VQCGGHVIKPRVPAHVIARYKLPGLLFERRSSAIFGVVIIIMLWGGLTLKYFDSVRTDLHEAERNNQNFTMVFEENVLRSIGENRQGAPLLAQDIRNTGEKPAILIPIVDTTDVLSEIIVQVAIVDADGIIRASNAITQSSTPIPCGRPGAL